MRYSFVKLYAPLALVIALAGCHGRIVQHAPDRAGATDVAGLSAASGDDSDLETGNPKLHPVSVEDAGNIAQTTAQLLERQHYLKDLDHTVLSDRMFSLYVESLDPLHYYLLQSDIDAFQEHKAGIYDKVLDSGDTSLASQMYARYQQRFDESIAVVTEALKAGEFKFDNNETIAIDRKNAQPPKTMDEAKTLWLERLRYEYLQEKLSKSKPADIEKTLTKRYARISRT